MEIMIATSAIRNLIREGKTHQIDSAVQTGIKFGMKSMDMSLIELYRKSEISYEEMIKYCVDKELMDKYIAME